MTTTQKPAPLQGELSILPSKSHLHRLLICAALSDTETHLHCGEYDGEDVQATIACLQALGGDILPQSDGLLVRPLRGIPSHEPITLPCGESGSTLRFLLPVVCALGVSAVFEMKGRLPDRPLAPLDAQLLAHGCTLRREGHRLHVSGQLTGGHFHLPGNISSQYISGLLFALPLLNKESRLFLEGAVESADYIHLTLDSLALFQVQPTFEQDTYTLHPYSRYQSPGSLSVEGDWSNAAFWLCAGALPGGDVRCHGLSPKSRQGDKAIVEILKQMGASLSWDGESLCSREGHRQGVVIDAAPIPDLIPPLAVVAALSKGETHIQNAARLRLKESDRLAAISQTLIALGADIMEEADGLRIRGKERLLGGRVDAWGDHRIAMMAAIASIGCTHPVTIDGAEAVKKSYPAFWSRLHDLTTKEGS